MTFSLPSFQMSDRRAPLTPDIFSTRPSSHVCRLSIPTGLAAWRRCDSRYFFVQGGNSHLFVSASEAKVLSSEVCLASESAGSSTIIPRHYRISNMRKQTDRAQTVQKAFSASKFLFFFKFLVFLTIEIEMSIFCCLLNIL